MSQLLTPVNGGVVPEVQTTTASSRLNVLSTQYVEVNGLQSRPTEWVPGGRPIYRRLPATSETYQINFFNVVTESNVLTSNTRVQGGIDKVGYVYVPWGESINGPTSAEVVASDNLQCVLIKAGVLVWEYGKTVVLPTIINLQVLDVLSGQYEVAYQLVYDDAPIAKLYQVSDFVLTGQPLTITGSTDGVVGWRYPTVNAFLNGTTLFWQNQDTYFPQFAQPAESYIQWESELSNAYSKVVLRCPSGTAYTGTASLFYVNENNQSINQTVPIQSDSQGQFFQFDIVSPSLQNGWKVEFSSLDISIQAITVSGLLTLLEPQASPSPRATLVMYPTGTLPKTVTNMQGEQVPATYCVLAKIDVDSSWRLLDIEDERDIIHRDYTPVADWLTKPFDDDLINLHEQVLDYTPLWMSPTSCMRQEYATLSTDQIKVEA